MRYNGGVRPVTQLDQVREFHRVVGAPVDKELTASEFQQRLNLIREETKELLDALSALFGATVLGWATESHRADLTKEMADVLYVVLGTAAALGIDLDEAFRRVHLSNMSKLGDDGQPILRESDGKVLKGPNYEPPDMLSVPGVKR